MSTKDSNTKTTQETAKKSKPASRGRRGLGRGLDALLGGQTGTATAAGPKGPGTAEEKTVVKVTSTLSIDALEPNRFQPRSEFDDTGLEELAESIRNQGIVQPIVVTPKSEDGKEVQDRYVIVAGERRWRAARRAGLEEVPIVVRQVADDQQLLELALVENIQRADLNPVEEAEAYRILADRFDLSQDEIGTRVGKGRTTITNFLRLLRLPEEIQDMLRSGKLSAGQARPLIPISDRARQVELAERAVEEGLTARALEALAQEKVEPPSKKEKKVEEEADVHTRAAMDKLTQSLQTRVDIVRKKRGGQVRIFFHSEDELIRLYDRLMEGID